MAPEALFQAFAKRDAIQIESWSNLSRVEILLVYESMFLDSIEEAVLEIKRQYSDSEVGLIRN